MNRFAFLVLALNFALPIKLDACALTVLGLDQFRPHLSHQLLHYAGKFSIRPKEGGALAARERIQVSILKGLKKNGFQISLAEFSAGAFEQYVDKERALVRTTYTPDQGWTFLFEHDAGRTFRFSLSLNLSFGEDGQVRVSNRMSYWPLDRAKTFIQPPAVPRCIKKMFEHFPDQIFSGEEKITDRARFFSTAEAPELAQLLAESNQRELPVVYLSYNPLAPGKYAIGDPNEFAKRLRGTAIVVAAGEPTLHDRMLELGFNGIGFNGAITIHFAHRPPLRSRLIKPRQIGGALDPNEVIKTVLAGLVEQTGITGTSIDD